MNSSSSSVKLLDYQEVLKRIQGYENHLLLGNGFNRGLGVNTSYASIFQKMTESDFGLYKEAESLVKECGEDLERFIGRLTDDIDTQNHFLKKFVSNKIKMDFMKATHEIVKTTIKNVYAEENTGVYILLNSFTNYFTLNYDPFLYLLLLHFKSGKETEDTALAMEPSLKFKEDDLNARENNIYTEIRHAREHGTLVISGVDGNTSTTSSLSSLTKAHFVIEISEYSKRNNKDWKKKDINKVVDSILEEEKKHKYLNKVDDGSRQQNLFGTESEFVFDIESATQNIFFLHGAFHIYKDGKSVRKITQSDKALYDRVEDILNNDERELVCIFQTKNKKDEIEKNTYLTKCLHKLNTLSGIMVIIGSSLDDNDDHIFDALNSSKIDTLYISSLAKDKDKVYERAMQKFSGKSVYLFDAQSISYKLPVVADSDDSTVEAGT
ncbi:MAG: DUF4917 family protein [Candidatus Hodarchaeales archaeon]